MSLESTYIGVDAGGTLIKLAYVANGTLYFKLFPSSSPQAAADWITAHDPNAVICATGGKAALLQSLLPVNVQRLPEFDATCAGIRFLLEEQGKALSTFVLTNVGTGTSIHWIAPNRHMRIGGTGVGGGTLMGLGSLLSGITDFTEIVRLAHHGERSEIDLLVKHIYEGAEPPISGELTASNFGRVVGGSGDLALRVEDRLAALTGLVGETVATTSVLAAAQFEVDQIVYIGSSFDDNELLKKVAATYTIFRGANPNFIERGAYSGALGALLSLEPESRPQLSDE